MLTLKNITIKRSKWRIINNMKRLLCILLALLCFVSMTALLVSCNDEGGNDEGDQPSNSPFYVVYKDVKIELNKSAEDVLKKLGEPKYEDNLGDCGGIGVQMKYTYDDITVNTLKEKDGEKIHKISFVNDIASTPKKISIGSTEQEVRDAYGEPSSYEDGRMTYKSGDLKLEFVIDNGEVKSVNYTRVR